ncbi:hypothetical protein LEM8419_00478 [Neolewinella maritima]|uniref:WD40-like Beta Propeller Repeat n=2 Tax=Neolewinella maritima TaxID=1383882 RepID=A0ABM9AY11_9BACT|nr:hypothetical protein LEM8419_00478 [Neolewinella maritima]
MMTKHIVYLLALLAVGCTTPKTSEVVVYADGPVREATVFAPGIISTDTHSEFSPTFSPDGRTIYFPRRAPEEKQQIYVSNFVDGSWTPPTVAAFSTDRDETPYITPDGRRFFFGSERPIPGRPNLGGFDMNVWMMEATPTGWSTPAPLPSPINEVQQEGEQWPTANNNLFFTPDNETYYFTTLQPGAAAIQLFQTTYRQGSFSPPTRITGLFDDPQYAVYSAVVSPDGRYLVFNSYGVPSGAGGEDLFVSRRTAAGWSPAVPLGDKVNSPDEESEPRFSRDGRYFFFTRAENLGNYTYGEWNIMYLDTEALGLDQLFD